MQIQDRQFLPERAATQTYWISLGRTITIIILQVMDTSFPWTPPAGGGGGESQVQIVIN